CDCEKSNSIGHVAEQCLGAWRSAWLRHRPEGRGGNPRGHSSYTTFHAMHTGGSIDHHTATRELSREVLAEQLGLRVVREGVGLVRFVEFWKPALYHRTADMNQPRAARSRSSRAD